jgi:hypothetical protein
MDISLSPETEPFDEREDDEGIDTLRNLLVDPVAAGTPGRESMNGSPGGGAQDDRADPADSLANESSGSGARSPEDATKPRLSVAGSNPATSECHRGPRSKKGRMNQSKPYRHNIAEIRRMRLRSARHY